LYSNGDPVAIANAVSQLSGATISIRRGAGRVTEWHIANEPDGMFGAMRDLRIQPSATHLGSGDFFHTDGESLTPLIAGEDKAAFLKLNCNGLPVFVSSERLIDIDAELTTFNFDIRDHFFSAVPLVSYIRWAFPQSSWHAPEASACLVIDDPLLKPTHGFVDFSGTSVPDEATQLFYEYRIHPMELEEECSRSCSTVPRKPRAFLTFGSRLRSYPGGVR
jgi:hypothetical protein